MRMHVSEIDKRYLSLAVQCWCRCAPVMFALATVLLLLAVTKPIAGSRCKVPLRLALA